MIHSLFPELSPRQTASLTIDSDLRAAGANAEWRRLNLPGGNEQKRERIDHLFAGSEVAACVLDVLASGTPMENVVVRQGLRFLCAGFQPLPSGSKPKKVRMEAWDMPGQLILDGETGEVLSANEAAKAAFGEIPSLPIEKAALDSALRNGSHVLGRFVHRRPDGREVELESVLAIVEDSPRSITQ